MSKSKSFSIGILSSKYGEHLEIMFNMARVFGANSIFGVGTKWSSYSIPNSKNRRTEHYPPYDYFPTFEEFIANHVEPSCSELVIVDTRLISDNAEPLENFVHPEKATYLFIGRDSFWPTKVLEKAGFHVKISDDLTVTPGTAGAILLYDRHFKFRKEYLP